jgi:hypothetical protein
VNVKKAQFLAPLDHAPRDREDHRRGNERVIVTERGTSFGYNNLVVGHAGPADDARLRLPGGVRRDAQPAAAGRGDGVTAGLAEYIEPLAAAGVAAGVDGVFMEVHEDPSRARSDAANALRLDRSTPSSPSCSASTWRHVPAPHARAEPARHERRRTSICRARRVLQTESGRRAGAGGPARRALRARRPSAARLPRPRDRHRHGQVRDHLPQDRGHAGQHRHAAFFLHPAEAIHGDLGVLQPDDVVGGAVYSGETDELLRLLETIKRSARR